MPPPEGQQLQWVEINDFSPGIWSSRATPNAPLGAATTGTYGCVATSDGCLAPGPEAVYSFTQSLFGTGSRPTGQNRMVTLASACMSPIHEFAIATFQFDIDSSTYPEELAITYGQFIDPASGSAWQYRTDNTLYKLWDALPPSTYTIKSVNSTTMLNANAFNAPWNHGWADYAQVLEAGALVTLPRLASMLQHFRGNATVEIRVFPADATPTTDSTATVTTPSRPWMILGHQGRLVTVNMIGVDVLGSSAAFLGANDLWYYPVRNPEGSSPSILYKPVEENQSGIAAAASMSANELFIIKNQGGGALIRGDLDNPNVLRMPTWHSTHGYLCKPVATPIGLVYGGRFGVYVWNGAESTASISPQFDSDYPQTQPFWDVNTTLSTDIDRVGHAGQFEFVYPWVLAPNNWMFDIRHQSWWKLGVVATPNPPIFSYHAATNGCFWAIPAYIDGSQTTAAVRYDTATQNASYTWYSQPITLAKGRQIQVRQVSVVANAPGSSPATSTVDITLVAAQAGVGNNPEILATTSHAATSYPTMARMNSALSGDSIQVIAQATSTSASHAAPTIRSIRIGYVESTQAPGA